MIIRVRTKEGTSRVSIDAKSPLFRDFKENFIKNNMKISNITIKELAWDINGSKVLQIPSSHSHLHEDQVPMEILGIKHGDLLFLIENNDNMNGGNGSRSLSEGISGGNVEKREETTTVPLPTTTTTTSLYHPDEKKYNPVDDDAKYAKELQDKYAFDDASNAIRPPDEAKKMVLFSSSPTPSNTHIPYEHISSRNLLPTTNTTISSNSIDQSVRDALVDAGISDYDLQLELQRLRDEQIAHELQSELYYQQDLDRSFDSTSSGSTRLELERIRKEQENKQKKLQIKAKKRNENKVDCPDFYVNNDDMVEDSDEIMRQLDSLLKRNNDMKAVGRAASNSSSSSSSSRVVNKSATTTTTRKASSHSVIDAVADSKHNEVSDGIQMKHNTKRGAKPSARSASTGCVKGKSPSPRMTSRFTHLLVEDDTESEELCRRLAQEEDDIAAAMKLQEDLDLQYAQLLLHDPVPSSTVSSTATNLRDEQEKWLRERNQLHNDFHDILTGQATSTPQLMSSVDDEINELYKHFSIAARAPLGELDPVLSVGSERIPPPQRSFSPVVVPTHTYQDDDEEEDLRRAIEESLKFK